MTSDDQIYLGKVNDTEAIRWRWMCFTESKIDSMFQSVLFPLAEKFSLKSALI